MAMTIHVIDMQSTEAKPRLGKDAVKHFKSLQPAQRYKAMSQILGPTDEASAAPVSLHDLPQPVFAKWLAFRRYDYHAEVFSLRLSSSSDLLPHQSSVP